MEDYEYYSNLKIALAEKLQQYEDLLNDLYAIKNLIKKTEKEIDEIKYELDKNNIRY